MKLFKVTSIAQFTTSFFVEADTKELAVEAVEADYGVDDLTPIPEVYEHRPIVINARAVSYKKATKRVNKLLGAPGPIDYLINRAEAPANVMTSMVNSLVGGSNEPKITIQSHPTGEIYYSEP